MKKKLLVREDGQEVKVGDQLLNFRDEMVEVVIPLTHTDKVYVKFVDRGHPQHGQKREFYPSVIKCRIEEVEVGEE